MAQYKYKLKEGHTPDDTFIPGVRISKEGTVESNARIESPVLELIEGGEPQTDQPVAPVQAVTPVAPPAPAPVAAAPAPEVTTNTEIKEQQ